MKFLLFLLLIVIFVLIYTLFKKTNKSVLITIVCTILIIQIILSPAECMKFTISGAKLFFNSVFPSLFPFLIICNMMLAFKGVEIYSKILGSILCRPLRLPKECSIAITISCLCGYPLGAKYSSDLYESKIINGETYLRLLNIASNPGPLFVIGAVGTSMLHNTYLGYLLLISSYISCFTMSFLIPAKKLKQNNLKNAGTLSQMPNIGVALKNSVDNAVTTSLFVGGFIVIFSVITSIIKSNVLFNIACNELSRIFTIPQNLFSGTTLGLLEMTNGCFFISLSSLNTKTVLALTSFLINFSGLSVIAQVYSLTYKHNISLKRYISYKFIQGIISSIISIFILQITPLNFALKTFVTKNNVSDYNYYVLFFIIIIIIITPMKLKKLFHIS